MESVKPRRKNKRWLLPLVMLVVGASLGFCVGHTAITPREPAQFVIDTLAKPVPPPPVGTLAWQDAGTNAWSGRSNNGPISVRYGRSVAVDITAAADGDSIDKIIRFYQDYYATAIGRSWGAHWGNSNFSLSRKPDGTFEEMGFDHGWGLECTDENAELHVEANVIDFPDKQEMPFTQPHFVSQGNLGTEPINGRRILWLRFRGSVDNLSGPVKFAH